MPSVLPHLNLTLVCLTCASLLRNLILALKVLILQKPTTGIKFVVVVFIRTGSDLNPKLHF